MAKQVVLGVCGVGTVGQAVIDWAISIQQPYVCYDKYKDCGYEQHELLTTDFCLLCLPTKYMKSSRTYDTSAIYEVLQYLQDNEYKGLVVLRSTVLPGTTADLSTVYHTLKLCFSPEFLTARTASSDFANQKHIVVGFVPDGSDNVIMFVKWLNSHFTRAIISLTTAVTAETLKIVANSFYSVKIQFFTEIYLLCRTHSIDYDEFRHLLVLNGWTNPEHTRVPGPDGLISYGGACFPKDTQALLQHMKNIGIPNAVLDACITERNKMRDDDTNITD